MNPNAAPAPTSAPPAEPKREWKVGMRFALQGIEFEVRKVTPKDLTLRPTGRKAESQEVVNKRKINEVTVDAMMAAADICEGYARRRRRELLELHSMDRLKQMSLEPPHAAEAHAAEFLRDVFLGRRTVDGELVTEEASDGDQPGES